MWAAKHCSMLFLSGQNRLCVFCCVSGKIHTENNVLHFASNVLKNNKAIVYVNDENPEENVFV